MIYKEFCKVRLIFLNSSFFKKISASLIIGIIWNIPQFHYGILLKQTIMGWIRLIFKVVNIFPSVNKKKKIARERKMKISTIPLNNP